MATEKEKSQRRVYVLPNELVERITGFQTEMGIQSEVEAVRRLLDNALKGRDDWRSITKRFLEKLKDTPFLTDIARDVLIGHPLVHRISTTSSNIIFELTTGETVDIGKGGNVHATDSNNNILDFEPRTTW